MADEIDRFTNNCFDTETYFSKFNSTFHGLLLLLCNKFGGKPSVSLDGLEVYEQKSY